MLDSKSEKCIFWLFALVRNLIWIFIYQVVVFIINSQQKIELILTFIITIVFYFLFTLLFEQTPIDKILGIQVVEKKLR
ncbi:hypothetical protein Fleli_2823 [Bernardetia litoralis DSM 6794]|uniref:Uncharacterized protein n=1 Tax=Bernardetia litoralis (strain ATCC 23117 / DSM 6794 / NBRC 15988 / NCIMB 1366 / Fx l1 / Sio-4) TaxID=880071 RepID=I4AMJ1_BERLS|nr:hypothetical protein Fleli_2823 [Bernardetia litoralis DSM 6794]